MKVGLYNLEPKVVNAALMKVSQYHKNRGDRVEWYNPLFHNSYDKIYASSLFKYTDKSYVRSDMICGGPGFDHTAILPKYIEKSDYDWSLYPNCDYSMIWFSKGCIRKCDFCLVHSMEGSIYSLNPKNLNPNGSYIKVNDNNFFANPKWREAISWLKEANQPIDMNGIDVRILTKEMYHALNELKHKKDIHLAWDNPRDNSLKHIKRLVKYVKPYKLMCYVLIGYWSTPEEDMMRINELTKLKVDAFVMPFNKQNKYQKAFARWVNCKQVFRSTTWEKYKYNPENQ